MAFISSCVAEGKWRPDKHGKKQHIILYTRFYKLKVDKGISDNFE